MQIRSYHRHTAFIGAACVGLAGVLGVLSTQQSRTLLVVAVVAIFSIGLLARPIVLLGVVMVAQAWLPKTNLGGLPAVDFLFGVWLAALLFRALVVGRKLSGDIALLVGATLLFGLAELLLGSRYVGIATAALAVSRQTLFCTVLLWTNLWMEPSDRQTVAEVLVWSSIPVAIVGLAESFSPNRAAFAINRLLNTRLHYPIQVDYLRYVDVAGHVLLRATSTMIDPNVLGGYFLVVLPMAVYLLDRTVGLKRAAVWVALVSLGGCTVATLSREAMIGAVLELAAYFALRREYKALTIAAMAAAAIGISLARRVSQTTSIVLRGKLVISALTAWLQAPLWGIGAGSNITPFALPSEVYAGAGSAYLSVLADGGIGALALYLAIWWKALKSCLGRHDALYIALLLGFAAAEVMDTYFYTDPTLSFFYYLVLGMALVQGKVRQPTL